MDEIAANHKKGFFRHVFQMDESSRQELMNIAQYSLVAFLPVIIFNKLVQKIIPEANEDKSSLEMSLEIVFQVILVFIGVFFLHRIVTYVPTYSGQPYSSFDPNHIVVIGLLILTSMSTKLGEKVAILMERAGNYWQTGGRPPAPKQPTQASGQITGNPMPSAAPPTQINHLPPPTTPQQGVPSQYVPQGENTILAANEAIGGNAGFGSLF